MSETANTEKIRVLIADDHEMVRKGIRAWLEAEADIEVVEDIQFGKDIARKTLEYQPDVLMMDLHFPEIHGMEVIRALRDGGDTTPILVMTGYDKQRAKAVLEAGANGFINKEESRERILDAIRWAAHREEGIWLSPAIAQEVIQSEKALSDAELTKTELKVLALIELTNTQIAETLSLSEGTVKNHISSIYSKLGVSSRQEAGNWGRKNGVVERGG